jgi:hypothetical protein
MQGRHAPKQRRAAAAPLSQVGQTGADEGDEIGHGDGNPQPGIWLPRPANP